MGYGFLIVIIVVILYLILKPKVNNSSINESGNSQEIKKEPRNFIMQADSWLNPPIKLRSYVDTDKQEAIKFLINCLSNRTHQIRKQAAYALGQIGDENLLSVFEKRISSEAIIGVKEAMEACYVAIQMAPADKGYTEMHRRQLIDNVYYKRPVTKPQL
jgi:hypothetical protein